MAALVACVMYTGVSGVDDCCGSRNIFICAEIVLSGVVVGAAVWLLCVACAVTVGCVCACTQLVVLRMRVEQRERCGSLQLLWLLQCSTAVSVSRLWGLEH